MPFYRNVIIIILFAAFSVIARGRSDAKVLLQQYGVNPDASTIRRASGRALDSVLSNHPLIKDRTAIYAIDHPRVFTDRTMDFYLLLLLVTVLGLIRLSDPKYFPTLWQAFKNPTLSSRQLKDKIESSTVQNLLMNLFFAFSLGAYLFYVIRYITFRQPGGVSSLALLLMLAGGVMLIYLGKYAVIRFSGWAFRVENITDHYIFNVFFINKIIAIVLLPFTLVLAFASSAWAQPALLVSGIGIVVLLSGRYLRSWQIFGSFFQYSKFHFFMYLCASELLPLAVLMKLLVRGLLIDQ